MYCCINKNLFILFCGKNKIFVLNKKVKSVTVFISHIKANQIKFATMAVFVVPLIKHTNIKIHILYEK